MHLLSSIVKYQYVSNFTYLSYLVAKLLWFYFCYSPFLPPSFNYVVFVICIRFKVSLGRSQLLMCSVSCLVVWALNKYYCYYYSQIALLSSLRQNFTTKWDWDYNTDKYIRSLRNFLECKLKCTNDKCCQKKKITTKHFAAFCKRFSEQLLKEWLVVACRKGCLCCNGFAFHLCRNCLLQSRNFNIIAEQKLYRHIGVQVFELCNYLTTAR